MLTSDITQTVPMLMEPLASAGFYPTTEQALKHIVLDFIDRKIAWAQAKVRRYEKKHGQSFAEYTTARTGRATIADEDEWMEWESLIEHAWKSQEVKAEVQRSNVR